MPPHHALFASQPLFAPQALYISHDSSL
jgi:hypothetical protein